MAKVTGAQIEVWRFQQDRIYPDIISARTKSRARFAAFSQIRRPATYDTLRQRLAGRSTMYLKAIVGGSASYPTLQILGEVDTW